MGHGLLSLNSSIVGSGFLVPSDEAAPPKAPSSSRALLLNPPIRALGKPLLTLC